MSRPISQRTRQRLTVIGFLSPWAVGFIGLVLIPFAITFYWSMTRFDMLRQAQWIGTDNYRRLLAELSQGEGFGVSLWNTFYYAAVSVPLTVALGVGLALMLSWRVRGQGVYRTLIFMPAIVPVVAASTLWLWLLDPQDGMVNYLLRPLSAEQNWFASPNEAVPLARLGEMAGGLVGGVEDSTQATAAARGRARPFGSKDALVLMSLWGVGNFMLIYLAAIRDIPHSLHEAAALDGAGACRRLWHVTIPMLTPVIFFNLVMGLIQSVQTFTQPYIVSEGTGGPVQSTLLLSIHLFLSAFQDLEMGYASAMAWILLVLLCASTLMLFRTSRYWVHYQGQVR